MGQNEGPLAQGWEKDLPAGTKLNVKIRRGQSSIVLAWRSTAAGVRRNRGTGRERRCLGVSSLSRLLLVNGKKLDAVSNSLTGHHAMRRSVLN